VKRIRFFSKPDSSGYEIALAVMAFVALSAASAAKRDLKAFCITPSGAQGYRVK
jgi:hypothetical protein